MLHGTWFMASHIKLIEMTVDWFDEFIFHKQKTTDKTENKTQY